MKTLICGGQVIHDSGSDVCDVLIEEGRIAAIGINLPRPVDALMIDACGLTVLPGMIDFHVHVDSRIGRYELSDTYHSGSKAAVLAGVTTLIGFVTQAPHKSLRECVDDARAKVNDRSYADVAVHLTPTRFAETDWQDIDDLIEVGCRTFKFYTTYKAAGLYQDYSTLSDIMRRLSDRNVRILIHAEDQDVLDAADREYADAKDIFSYAKLRSPQAEVAAIRHVAELARETGASIHIVHVSTAEGARLINEYRSTTAISCETAPQYLLLNDDLLAARNGHRYLCTPPLRSEENRRAMEQHAVSGLFDIFATDHCPFRRKDKDTVNGDVRNVPSGLAGVGGLVPLLYEQLVIRNQLPLTDLVKRLSTNPAQLAGLYPRKGAIQVGTDADLLILNRNGSPRPILSSYSDCYETYPDHTTTLDFQYVFLRGEIVVKDNMLTNPEQPTGRALWRN
ncbi:MAG: dihydroorotase [Calditrichota bacterium]